MSRITRRSFVRRIAAGMGTVAGGWFLTACGMQATATSTTPAKATTAPVATNTSLPPTATQPHPTETVSAVTPSSAATSAPSATAPPSPTAAPTPTAERPYLVVAHGGDSPEELVTRALAALGGIEQFVKPGNDVIIKPNVCVAYHTYEYAATTNPWVVSTLVKMCKSAGASRVRVMDFPFGGTASQAYAISGIQEQVLAAGGEMEIMAGVKFVKTDIPQALDIHNWRIYEDILKADVVINVPIAKHHSLARLTLGMKNLMGTVQSRESLHQNLGQRLADLTSRVRPALTIVDAVRILVANGPTGGNLDDVKKLDTVIASTDIVAADSYATSLFNMKPEDIAYIVDGAKMGLGHSDLSGVKIEQITVGG